MKDTTEPDVVKRQAHNDESIDEQGISDGAIPYSCSMSSGVRQPNAPFDSETGSALFVVVIAAMRT